MKRFIGFFEFLLFYTMDIVRSNFRVAHDVLTRQHHMTPGVIAVDVSDLNDRQTALMASFVTMTPGTLGIAVSEDHATLYIHAMYIDESPEALAAEIRQNYGRRVRNVF